VTFSFIKGEDSSRVRDIIATNFDEKWGDFVKRNSADLVDYEVIASDAETLKGLQDKSLDLWFEIANVGSHTKDDLAKLEMHRIVDLAPDDQRPIVVKVSVKEVTKKNHSSDATTKAALAAFF
jgi:hypothetical protein